MADNVLVLTDSQETSLTIAPTDKKGKPAPVESVSWTSSDAGVIALTPAADGLSCLAVAGNPGTAQVSVSVDAEIGDGVVTLTGTLTVNVIGGQAVALGITAGTPVEQA